MTIRAGESSSHTCNHCNKRIVRGIGSKKATILFIGDYPNQDEVLQGHIGGERTSLDIVLIPELNRAGISQLDYFVTNLWGHAPEWAGTKVSHNECFDSFVIEAVRKMEEMKYVMLMGAEIAYAFLDDSIMSYAGLEVTSPRLPTGPTYYAMPTPKIALHSGIGDIRLSLQKFSRRINNDRTTSR